MCLSWGTRQQGTAPARPVPGGYPLHRAVKEGMGHQASGGTVLPRPCGAGPSRRGTDLVQDHLLHSHSLRGPRDEPVQHLVPPAHHGALREVGEGLRPAVRAVGPRPPVPALTTKQQPMAIIFRVRLAWCWRSPRRSTSCCAITSPAPIRAPASGTAQGQRPGVLGAAPEASERSFPRVLGPGPVPRSSPALGTARGRVSISV